ncbi:MAG: Gfo/Idh/MocA family oxidoreductase [Beijerinckiaceae bacterium]
MPANLRYGLIGAGMMAREHIRNLAIIPGSQVTAYSDPDEGSRRTTGALLPEARAFVDHRDLIDSGIVDAIIIASPNDTHAAILCDLFAAPRKLPALVEKPVCTRLEDCATLAAKASAHPAPVWVAMEYRFMPPVAELVQAVHGGAVGELKMLALREHRFPFLEKVGDWNRFSERTGGTLVEKCCHFFDLMRLVVRDEPARIFASGAMGVNHRNERYGGRTPDILDNAFVIVDFRSGVRAALDLCMFSEGSWWQEEIAATGDRAKVECFVPGPARFWPGGAEREAEIMFSPRAPKNPMRRKIHVDSDALRAGDHHGSTYYQHLGFRRAVVEGKDVEVTMTDGLKAVAMGLAAERSARERRVVAIDALSIE